MHHHTEERTDIFTNNFSNPKRRVNSRLIKRITKLEEEEIKDVLLVDMGLSVEFLARHMEENVDFSNESANMGNFVATM